MDFDTTVFEDLSLERSVLGLFCVTPEDGGRTDKNGKYKEVDVASLSNTTFQKLKLYKNEMNCFTR